MNIKVKRIFICALLACMILTTIPGGAVAESATETVTANFTTSDGVKHAIDFPYSDSFFSLDCNEYHHELAKISMGLTVASYRVGTETGAGEFLEEAGFTNIDLTPYETLPTTDSIANCIGSKKIGDTTVIAVGVCGGDYGKEWASNFKVGDEERHVGFNEAAQQVIERINEFISTNNITGKKILWISGQSRAGATSNIVAADMTDSGMFEKVYAYTFGTPRTTRDKGNYKNIFNIMSKDDVVPKVPLPDWGYERYGVDLYLPAQEFDSNYPEKAYKAYYAIPGEEGFRNNTELYGEFRVIFGYLYELFPDAETYETKMQDKLRDIISSNSTSDMLTVLQNMAKAIEPEDEMQQKTLDSLLSFLDKMVAKYVLYGNRSEIAKNQWLLNSDIASNMMIDHIVTTYVAWMLSSDDGEGLYSDNLEFIHLTLNTTADVSIYTGDSLVQTIHEDGTADYTGTGYTKDDIYLGYSRNGMQVQIDLPLDREYLVTYTPTEDEDGNMVAVKYDANSVAAKSVFSTALKAKEGIPCILKSSGNGEIDLVTEANSDAGVRTFSAQVPMSVITELENINVFNLSISELVNIWVITLGILGGEFLIHMICLLIRKVNKRQRRELSIDIIFFFNVLVFTIVQIQVWYYAPSLPFINETTALLSYIIMFAYAAKGKNKYWLIPYGIIMIGLLIYSYYNTTILTSGGIALLVFKQICLAAEAWLIRKKSKKREKKQPYTES